MIIGIDASRANVSERTGTELYAFEVIRRLVGLVPDHHIRLYVREPLRLDWGELKGEIEVCILRWPPGVLWSHLRLSWELLWRKPDLLFVPADTVPLIHPNVSVTTIHDLAFERFPELYRQASVQRRLGWLRPFIHLAVRIFTLGRYSASERDYHRWSVRQAIKACRRILTVSEFSKQEITSLLDVAPERISVTPLGVRQAEYYQSITPGEQQDVRQKHNCQKPYLLFISRLEKKKSIGQVLEAYCLYATRTEDPVDLVLIGQPGFGWEEAQQKIPNPLQKNIHVLGWQPDRVRDVLHSAATALICISQYEGFGIPALESLSAGVPVIASRHGSLPEVLGAAAYYIDTNVIETIVMAIERITEYIELRKSLINLGHQQVAGFTWERTATMTAEALLSELA